MSREASSYYHHQAHYLVLDAARGIAALAVMLYHVQKYVFPEVEISFLPHLLHRSYLAVDLFFLMSGLVIARSYEARLLDGRLSFLGFCRVRAIRLYPLYLAGLMLGLGYALVKSIMKPEEAIALSEGLVALFLNGVFLPVVREGGGDIFPFNPAAWSLALEWGINLIYAAWAVRQKTSVLTGLSIAAGLILIPVAIAAHSLDLGWGMSTAMGGILRIGFSFTLGVIIYRRLSAGGGTIRLVESSLLFTCRDEFLSADSSGRRYGRI